MRTQATRCETSNLSLQPPFTKWIWRFTFNYYTLCCDAAVPNKIGLLNSDKNSCILPNACQTSDVESPWFCSKLRQHQSHLSTLHQLSDSVTPWIILGLKDNGYPKQSWQNPSILCHAVSNVPVFGPSAVEELNGAASFSLIMNTDCQTSLRNFADCSLFQSQLKGRTWSLTVKNKVTPMERSCWSGHYMRPLLSSQSTRVDMANLQIFSVDCCWLQ